MTAQNEADSPDEAVPYRLSLGLGVLEHLSEGLYSSLAAVLTEAVANAWDADARSVRIDVAMDEDRIRIADDGCGMDRDAVNDRFLKVAYKRRQSAGQTTSGRRLPMGRKGIGKLALLWAADIVEVETKRDGREVEAFRIDGTAIRSLVQADGTADYRPEPIAAVEPWGEMPHGTVIRLSSLKRDRLRDVAPDSLRRRLARRFAVAGRDDFRIVVNGTPIGPEDRQMLNLAQFVWIVDGTPEPTGGWVVPEDARLRLEARHDGFVDPEWRVRGWIATLRERKAMSSGLNSIVVMARGRLVSEDILPEIQTGEIFTKYLTGQIEADFLDLDDRDDVVTSDRQRLREDDFRVQALKKLLREHLRAIGPEWLRRRQQRGKDALLSEFPALRKWLEDMPTAWRGLGERFLGRIATLPDDMVGSEGREDLLRTGIMGFQRLRLREAWGEIEQALDADDTRLLQLFRERDELEASLYRDILINRVEMTRKLQALADENVREKILQEFLFKHLWLLDPSWDRATGNAALEERMRVKDCFVDDETTKDRYGRVDIRYRSAAGKHVLVELKRASARPSLGELMDQGGKYVDALKELLADQGETTPSIEVVFVLGRDLREPLERIEASLRGLGAGSRVTTYERLSIRARQTYNAFLEKSREIDVIEQLLRPANATAAEPRSG